MRDRKKRPVLESAPADGTIAARSSERKTRHVPFEGSFLQITPAHANTKQTFKPRKVEKIHLGVPPRSCCLLMVITQESAQSLAALNRPVAADVRTPREQQDVALPLMIPLGMEMFDILAQGSPQGAVCTEN
jgi:hypothetical protein